MEKRLLQIAIVVGAAIAVLAGLRGVVRGPALAGADGEIRFLSGLLVGIGAIYATLVPRIETEGQRLFLLTLIVVAGGFFRAAGMLIAGPDGLSGYAALAMTLVAAPGVYLWQTRISRMASMDAPRPWG